MEHMFKKFGGDCAHKRFFKWAKEKMTAEDAFYITYGDKRKEYPAEMKKEFTELFEENKKAHKVMHDKRKVFADKWKEYAPEDYHKCNSHDLI